MENRIVEELKNYYNEPMKKIKLPSKNILRFIIFCLVYFLINYFYPVFTSKILGYSFSIQDAFLVYIFPLTVLALLLMSRTKNEKEADLKQDLTQTIVFLIITLAILATPAVKPLIEQVVKGDIKSNPLIIVIYYAQLIAGNFFLFLAVFNLGFIKKLRVESALLPLPIALYIGTQFLVENQWKVFSSIIMKALGVILPFFSKSVYLNPENFNIKVEKFSIFVGPPCAGFYSIATLILLFCLSMAVVSRTRKIQKMRALISLLVGLVLVFILNIIRIAIIILVGAYISPDLAIKIFHEYLSAIFIIALFMIYLYKIIPKITQPK